jgi:hypothetical protein
LVVWLVLLFQLVCLYNSSGCSPKGVVNLPEKGKRHFSLKKQEQQEQEQEQQIQLQFLT